MIRISFDELEPGMVLAAPIRHPSRTGHVLLHAGYRPGLDIIGQLRRFRISTVWVQHPGFDFLDEKLREAIPRSRVKLYETTKRSFTGVANKTAGAFSLIEYRTVVSDIIMSLVTNNDNAVLAERVMTGGGELFAHCANVAYLSLVVGMRLRDYVCDQRKHIARKDAEDLTNLGVGAMLHDLGKLGLPVEFHEPHFFEDAAAADEYRTHPERGYDAIRGRVEATAAVVVRQHHQRFDGRGFPAPKPLPGKETALPQEGTNIHVFARIVAVANAIDGLTSACAKRGEPLMAALCRIQGPSFSGMFDPIVLDAALRAIPPFPLGTCVMLSDGSQAVITDLNESAPCCPKVGPILAPGVAQSGAYREIDLAAPGGPSVTSEGGRPVGRFLYTTPLQCNIAR
ncbi:MAG: HD domain-containing protein [bacterium]|nr:HD domain-containing protein [bacterium]